MADGGAAPAVLNAANEVAVDSFLRKKLRFSDIAAVVETVLSHCGSAELNSFEAVKIIDAEARCLAVKAVKKFHI